MFPFLSLLPALPGPRWRSPGQGPLHPRPAKPELAPSPQRPDEWEQEGLLHKCRKEEGSLCRGEPSNRGAGFHTTSPLHQVACWPPCLMGSQVLPPCSGLGSGTIALGDPVFPSSHARWGPHLPVTQEDFKAACVLVL